jgi:hypothetical protein
MKFSQKEEELFETLPRVPVEYFFFNNLFFNMRKLTATDKNRFFDIQNRQNFEYAVMVGMCFGYFLHTPNFFDFGCHILCFVWGSRNVTRGNEIRKM